MRRVDLDATLDVADGIVDFTLGVHGLVSGERADLLLGLSFNFVAVTLDVGLGGGFSEGVVGLGLLDDSAGDHVRRTKLLAKDLLGAAHIGTHGVCNLFGDTRHCGGWSEEVGWRRLEEVV